MSSSSPRVLQPSPARRSSCLRSFAIYNPTLSKGKEERAMDNTIFFYPPTISDNQQMNHVGLCIAVMCVAERFNPNGPTVDEIRSDARCISIFSPAPNIYMALETDELYDSAICVPLMQKAYRTFVLRHGSKCLLDPKGLGRDAIDSFFTAFCELLEKFVMNVLRHHNVQKDAPSSRSASPTGSLLGGAATERWKKDVQSEALLHCPVRLLSMSTYQSNMCNSVVAQYLSIISAQCRQGHSSRDGEQAEAAINAFSSSLMFGSINREGSLQMPCDSLQSSPQSSAINRSVSAGPNVRGEPCDDLLPRASWCGLRCLLLQRSDHRLILSTCGEELTTSLTFLAMVEHETLAPFIAFLPSDGVDSVTEQKQYCSIHLTSDVILFLLVEDSLHRQLHASIEATAQQLCREVADLLRTGSCSILRESAISSLSVRAKASRCLASSSGGVTTPTTATSASPLQNSAQWLCWNQGIAHGVVLGEHPRMVQWTLGALLREVIMNRKHVQDALTNGERIGKCSQKASMAALEHRGAREIVETWLPLGAEGWIHVLQSQGRIVGTPFYMPHAKGTTSSASAAADGLEVPHYFGECIEVGDAICEKLFHDTHASTLFRKR